MVSTGRILVAIVQICKDAGNWAALNEHVQVLAKRRSQLKQAVVKMVQECCSYVDVMPTKDLKVQLIDTLRSVTEGKVRVQIIICFNIHILAKIFYFSSGYCRSMLK